MKLPSINIKLMLMVCLLMLSGGSHAATAFQSNEKADITIVGFLLNGKFISGGPVVNVDADKATSFKNGKCLFNVEYDLKNTGEVKTSPQFSVVLKRKNTTVKTHNLLSLNANSHKVMGFQSVELSPGLNEMGLYADSGKVVNESNENNNYRKALIKIRGNCGDKATPGFKTTSGTQRSLPGGQKPKCKLGQIAVMEDGMWQCKQPGIKAKSKPQRAGSAGPKPKCKLGQIAVMEDGMWQCKQPGIKANTTPQRAGSAGPKPKCKLGQIAVMEDGMWQCKQPGIKANTTPQRAGSAGPKPKCKLGLIAVLEDGMWQCKQPGIKAR